MAGWIVCVGLLVASGISQAQARFSADTLAQADYVFLGTAIAADPTRARAGIVRTAFDVLITLKGTTSPGFIDERPERSYSSQAQPHFVKNRFHGVAVGADANSDITDLPNLSRKRKYVKSLWPRYRP